MDCDQKAPSNFFIFKYVKKQDVLITNIVSKVVTRLLYVFDFFFKVRGGGSSFSKLPCLRGFFEFMVENFIILDNF